MMDMPTGATMAMDMDSNSTMDGMDHGDMGNMDMDHSMMHMYFYFGVSQVTILFKSWTINGGGQMAGACFGVFLLAALYEGLKVLREMLLHKATLHAKTRMEENSDWSQNGVALMDSTALARPGRRTKIMSWWHLLQTLLHLIQVSISYALMLIFMTYNAYLAISILLGAGIGYFAFGWKKAVIIDVNEHCH